MYPSRIVCLTEEPTEVLYALGEEERIVGISRFTVRPARAKKEKPKVSAFTSADIDTITDLKPDLVIGFSDIQADIAAALIRQGIEVWISNHRTVDGILSYVHRLGAMVGCQDAAARYAGELATHLQRVEEQRGSLPRRPKVYFEEWNDPLITGITWVAELIRLAGGEDLFPEMSAEGLAKNRIIADPMTVANRAPDIILASWCGKKLQPQQVYNRPGWEEVPAIRDGEVHEIPSEIILQPGPAALTDGIDHLHRIFNDWVSRNA